MTSDELGREVLAMLDGAEPADYVDIDMHALQAAGIGVVSVEYCDWLTKFRLRQGVRPVGPGLKFIRLRKQWIP